MFKTSNRLREVREKLGLSGTKVAEKLDVSSQYYYDLETGRRRMNVDILLKLADFFGVSTDYLLGRTDNQKDDLVQDLPKTAQKEIEDFIEFVRRKYC